MPPPTPPYQARRSPAPAWRRARTVPWVPAAAATLATVATVLALVLPAAALVLRTAAAAAQPTIPGSAIRVDVSATAVSRPVPGGFVGLSIEYGSALYYFGSDPARPDPVFMQLVRNLVPGQSPVLRFGGDTTDWTWWNTPGVRRPGGIRYTLGPGWVQSTRATAQALNARLILGINLESDSRAIAATESDALVNGIGRRYVAGLELGNEPEVYGTLGWYQSPTGVSVPGRPAAYDFASYLRDYARISQALPSGVPLAGPASGAPKWLAGLSQYLAANPRVRLVTFHRYPLHRCYTPANSPEYPTIANLLAPAAASGPATSLQAAVAVAHARGIPLRADELNSVSCGGARGVSDTFASALWVLDALFNMARVGVDGVNIHTFQKAIYEPFAVQHENGEWQAQVRPMYYGLLLFTRAVPPGSRLLATSSPARAPLPPILRGWAARAPSGRISVVLINDSRRRPVTVAVQSPVATGSATGLRLRAPRASAQSGVTLGGQSFGATTTTGQLVGIARGFRLTAIQDRFVLRLPPVTATLLTVSPS
jgi:hypothetical protein